MQVLKKKYSSGLLLNPGTASIIMMQGPEWQRGVSEGRGGGAVLCWGRVELGEMSQERPHRMCL